ncbi:MAG: hydantoinase/oxoprolinase family protein [bacterium]|nr:hydantoinase/oxoprolinase family protein [bacterium]
MNPPAAARTIAGIDVGGTFTDLVVWDGARLSVGKVPSTPDDQSRGVIDALEPLGRPPQAVIHGTTVATNALLEGRGAATALVTTEGFEDVLAIGRQDRPSLYDSLADRQPPLAPVRVGVPRDQPDVSSPDLGEPESVAVSLLYGFRQGDAEAAVASSIRQRYPDVPISVSSSVVPEFREFERTSTTVLNAYLRPEMSRYLNRLAGELSRIGVGDEVGVMRSSGGLMSFEDAAALPVAALLSGPAGGVVAAARLAADMGYDKAISFDMGGTSTDVSRIENGEPQLTFERPVGGYPCRMASVDIHTVGAGGGSIGWRDPGGSLRVGPESAGAVPGPAGYGRGGTRPTVTDANLLLGRLDKLGESLRLDRVAAVTAMNALAGDLGLAVAGAARGIVTVVEETMAGAIRRVSVEEGVDPRGAVLVAFGGAGGLHAAALAKRLDMEAAVVPRFAGVFSALGLLLSPPRVDVALSISDHGELDAALRHVAAAAGDRLATASASRGSVTTSVDVRYTGQSHELSIPYEIGTPSDLAFQRFHELHHERNGFARPDDPIEIVTVRAVAQGEPALNWHQLPAVSQVEGRAVSTRQVIGADGIGRTASIHDRATLAPGSAVAGPAVVEEGAATTYLDEGDRATVASNGALVIEW